MSEPKTIVERAYRFAMKYHRCSVGAMQDAIAAALREQVEECARVADEAADSKLREKRGTQTSEGCQYADGGCAAAEEIATSIRQLSKGVNGGK